MLCLNRYEGENVIITTPEGRVIRVCFVRQVGRHIRLGFEADRDVTVHREEIQRCVDANANTNTFKGERDSDADSRTADPPASPGGASP